MKPKKPLSPKEVHPRKRRSAERRTTTDDQPLGEEQAGYIYDKPIQVPPHVTHEGHFMGFTLQIIITFNLALAYHKKAMNENDGKTQRNLFRKTLQLYELSYEWKMREAVPSLRFVIAVANNIGEVHRVAGNYSKYIMCLQHVLSTIVFMVDCAQDENEYEPMELEGFVRNTSRLILSGQCASAA